MKRTIEIEDTLQEHVNDAIECVQELLEQWVKDNPDDDECPDLYNDLDYSGSVHEIIDGCVPVYCHEIESTWYLHSSYLEEAYENSGIGDNPRENYGMVAIYCYIDQAVSSWYYDNADDLFQGLVKNE